MNFITKHFGARKAPTSDAISKALAQISAELTFARTRLVEVDARLQNLAVLTDDEHSAADIEQRALLLSIRRFEAQISELQTALLEAETSERLAALKARRAAVQHRVAGDAGKLLDRLDALFAEAARVLDEFQAIEREAQAVNVELRAAGLDAIDSAEQRYRKAADIVTPEVRRKRKKWVRNVAHHDGRGDDHDGAGGRGKFITQVEDISVFVTIDGKQVPNEAGAYEIEVEEVISPEQRRPGEWLNGLTASVRLPPARVGGAWHWPKA
jgi:hypothetical protein